MLSHLLAAVLFSNDESGQARMHIELSLQKRPGNAAGAAARRPHRARGKGL